jgi:3-oxoacyl-[acyl-carrier-protein] synthase-1
VSANPLAVLATGLATSVGLTSPSSCSAIRAKLTNPTQTRFTDSGGEWIMAHAVPLEHPWSGRTKLKKLAALAIGECLAEIPRNDWPRIPMVLCVAERDRPGRIEGLDNDLFDEICRELGGQFSEHSLVVPQGRVSASIALMHARRLFAENQIEFALIAATDSLLTWPTLSVYERAERLLTSVNSNGFMPGEGAGALLIGLHGRRPGLVCTGLGFADEPATIDSELPLRGEGLARAIRSALTDAGCEMHDLDFRIGDLSGEQYYFKEASLAVSRILRVRKEELSLWHQAECIGECGAASGVASIVVANAACIKGYAPGPSVLCHSANDSGQRAATVLQYRRPS